MDAAGSLRRQPTPDELCAFRARTFELARGPAAAATGAEGGDGEQAVEEDRATAAMLLRFDEFYSSGGCRDLLFHPQEQTFTLLQLEAMLAEMAAKVPL